MASRGARGGVAAAAGYLLGSIPSADIVNRIGTRGVVDLRSVGSGNPGAANAAAQLGRKWGAVVLVADLAKGTAAGVAGRVIGGDSGGYIAATTAVAGHIAPLWSGFKGGKAVATSAGACLAVFPAYFPMNAAVTALGASRSRNAERAVQLAALAWVGAGFAWWRFQLPNGWGPPPTRGLPAFSTASCALILFAFARARRGNASDNGESRPS
jgi:acyl phosphate:glycerol-3-phosphate acyltransferase